MKRTPLDALVTRKTLDFLNQNDFLVDVVVENLKENEEVGIPIKNVCAKVAAPLAEKIDQVCNLLGVSKRRFLEAAFTEALIKAEAIMEAEGLYERLEEMEEENRKQKETDHNEEAA